MERRLLLEGGDLDELLRRVREDHGHDARIVAAEQRLVGGVGGFFARRRFEVAVALDDPAGPVAPAESLHPDHPDDPVHPDHPGPLDRSDVTPRNGVQLDLAASRRRPITSLEELLEAAGQLDGAPPAPPAAQEGQAAQAAGEPAFEPAAYHRPRVGRHAAPVDPTAQQTTDGTAQPTVFDELMRDLAHHPDPGAPGDGRPSPQPGPPTRRSHRAAASYDDAPAPDPSPAQPAPAPAAPAQPALPAASTQPALPASIAAVLDAVAGPERTATSPQPRATRPAAQPSTPPLPQPGTLQAAPPHPAYAPVTPPPAPLVALGLPAPQADPRIALLDVLAGVAVRAPRSLTGVHVVTGDAVAIRELAATWSRHCAVDGSALLPVASAGSAQGDGLDAVRAGLPAALDLDGGALVLVEAGPSRAQARRAGRQVEAVRALVGGVADVSVTAVLDARWDVETTRDWLGALTCHGTTLTDLGAHGVGESAVPLRLLAHGLRVSWLDAAAATLGAWAGPCLDRMLDQQPSPGLDAR